MDLLINDHVSLVPQSIDYELQGPFASWSWGRNPIRPHDTKSQLPIDSIPEFNRVPRNRDALMCGARKTDRTRFTDRETSLRYDNVPRVSNR